jgi:transcription initiation factor TFIIIB Brf1 subunit/transcription initiation factor TFIIB
MMGDQCPFCNGNLNEVPGERDAVVCVDCGGVNPQDTYDEEKTTFPEESVTDAVNGHEHTDTAAESNSWKDNVGITDSTDENLVEILSILDSYIETLSLPQSVQLRAAEMLLSAWEEGLFAGRQKEIVTAGGVYAAARQRDHPRPLTKVSDTAGVAESKINTVYRVIVSELALEVPISTPDDYTPHVGDELSLPQSVVEEAEAVLSRDIDCSGNPAGIAASVLYLLAPDDQEITLQQAGSAAGVSKETVWRHSQTLRDSVPEVT